MEHSTTLNEPDATQELCVFALLHGAECTHHCNGKNCMVVNHHKFLEGRAFCRAKMSFVCLGF